MSARGLMGPAYGLDPHCALCSRPRPEPAPPKWVTLRTDLGPRLICPICALLVVKAASVTGAAEPR